MAGQYPETQALIDLLKKPAKKQKRDAFKEARRGFMPVLNEFETELRAELRAVEDAEAFEDHQEIRNRWQRIRGKLQAALKHIDTIQASVRVVQKDMEELEPLLEEQVNRAIEFGGYDNPEA